eukprot:979299-Prymnesium_polylepis.1
MASARAAAFTTLYKLEQKLGEGGQASAFRAVRSGGGQQLCLRMIKKASLKLDDWGKLDDEVRIWARASLEEPNGTARGAPHAGIVGLYELYETADLFVFVNELCQGGDLLERLLDEGDAKFTEMHARGVAAQLTAALTHLHALGIAHRDIKLENVLCTDDQCHLPGHCKFADFGFSAEFDPAFGGRFSRLVGTPEYQAPEAAAIIVAHRREAREGRSGGAKAEYTEAVDLWALGCMVYELLAGMPPYFSEDDDEQWRLILEEPLEFPSETFGGVSKQAQDLMHCLLDRDPSARLRGDALTMAPWFASEASGQLHREEQAIRMKNLRA